MECNPRKETPETMFGRLSQITVVTGIIIKLINIRHIGKDFYHELGEEENERQLEAPLPPSYFVFLLTGIMTVKTVHRPMSSLLSW